MDTHKFEQEELKELWTRLIDAPLPDDVQFELWASLFDAETARYGILQLAGKFRNLRGKMDSDYQIKFASSVMSRVARERRETKKETLWQIK